MKTHSRWLASNSVFAYAFSLLPSVVLAVVNFNTSRSLACDRVALAGHALPGMLRDQEESLR
jgi:hypothetical protein